MKVKYTKHWYQYLPQIYRY